MSYSLARSPLRLPGSADNIYIYMYTYESILNLDIYNILVLSY